MFYFNEKFFEIYDNENEYNIVSNNLYNNINLYKLFKNKYESIRFHKKKNNKKNLNNLTNYNFIKKSIGLINRKGFKKRYLLLFLGINLFFKKNNFYIYKNFLLYFLNIFNKFNLIYFLHFIKIHKHIRKYSRGKSGKYKYVYKYIPVFKRMKISLKIFFSEVRLRKKLNYSKSLKNLFFNFLFNTNKSIIYIIKKYTYNKIFKKYKYSMLLN